MTEFSEEDFLQLSGLQHFSFCRRQWALIHVENLWAENFRTVDGALLHERAHAADFTERRGDILITRGMAVFSRMLGVSGQCDVLEFRRRENGISLSGEEGLWQPYPVEYKRGAVKSSSCDALQLCAQAMCLEEMLCCSIPEGALYYGEARRREVVPLTEDLRSAVRNSLAEMHTLFRRGDTPRVRPTRACAACSLNELCLPRLQGRQSVSAYLQKHLEDAP